MIDALRIQRNYTLVGDSPMGDRGSILNLAGQSLIEVFLESNPELVSFHVHDGPNGCGQAWPLSKPCWPGWRRCGLKMLQ